MSSKETAEIPLFVDGTTKQTNGISSSDQAKESHQNGGLTGIAKSKSPIIDITKDLSALVQKQMKATPDAIALESERRTITYSQLDRKVTAIANRLRDHGVKRDSLVGVLLGRSADYVIGCLAALRGTLLLMPLVN